MIDELGLRRGTYCTEGQLGTTALGLGLIAAMPVQVVGAEHYFRAYHHLVSTAAPIHDEHGRITGILAIIGPAGTATSHTLSLVMAAARAISNQLQANLYLQEAIRRLTEVNAVLGAMREGVIAWDATGRINHVNPQVGRILHLNSTAVQGKPIGDVLQLPPLMSEALQQRSELRDVEASFELDAQTINALVCLRPMVEGTSHLVGSIAIIRPIEQVRQLVHQQVGAQALLTLQDISAASSDMRRVLRQATIAARGRAPVLLHGEGGVGKNALARAIHNAGGRADKPFIAISCRAIPHELMIPEFLGYDPSDTSKGRPSKFELAHGGTLLLEQIGLFRNCRGCHSMEERVMDETTADPGEPAHCTSRFIRPFSPERSWAVSLENLCVSRIAFNRIRCYTRMRTATIRGDTTSAGHMSVCLSPYGAHYPEMHRPRGVVDDTIYKAR